MRGDGASHVAGIGESNATPQDRGAVVTQRKHRILYWIFDSRPSGTELRMQRKRALSVLDLPDGTIRERQRVIGGAKLREQCNRALEVRDRQVVTACGRVKPAEPELGGWLGSRLADERLEQTAALIR